MNFLAFGFQLPCLTCTIGKKSNSQAFHSIQIKTSVNVHRNSFLLYARYRAEWAIYKEILKSNRYRHLTCIWFFWNTITSPVNLESVFCFTCINGKYRYACDSNITHFRGSVSGFKRKPVSSKVTISLVNCLKLYFKRIITVVIGSKRWDKHMFNFHRILGLMKIHVW